jgi:hypothetical protein
MLFIHKLSKAVLWAIADPDLAFYLNADPDPGSQTYADPYGSGSLSDCRAQELNFYVEKSR